MPKKRLIRMKRNKRTAAGVICLLLVISTVRALPGQERMKLVRSDTTSHSLIGLLRESTSQVFHDPSPPRFVMIDKSEKFLFGMGGYVSCYAYYDGTGFLSRDMVTSLIPMESSDLRSGRFNLDASSSRLFFKLIGNTAVGKLQAYIEGGFTARGNAFSLKHAYVEVRHILIGQTWSNIMDLKASPATVDGEGPGGLNGLRQPQVRYGWDFVNGVSFHLSLEDPEVTMLQDLVTGTEDVILMGQRFPDVIASFGYDREKWHMKVGGVMRFLEKQRGYGLAVSGHVNLSPRDVIMFQATAGAGIGHYIQDLGGMGYDVYLDGNRDLDKFRVLGYYAAYERHWSDRCFSGLVYSQVYVDPFEGAPGYLYKNTNYAALNTFWQIYEHGLLGIEAVYGDRRNHDGKKGYTWRLNCMLRYNF